MKAIKLDVRQMYGLLQFSEQVMSVVFHGLSGP